MGYLYTGARKKNYGGAERDDLVNFAVRSLHRPLTSATDNVPHTQKHVRTANIRAETFTELQVMLGEDFRALAEVFPEFKVSREYLCVGSLELRLAMTRRVATGIGQVAL